MPFKNANYVKLGQFSSTVEKAQSNPAAIALRRFGFKLGRTIGEGSYCKVKIAIESLDKDLSRRVACKVIDKKRASPDFITKFLPRELNIVRAIKHPNIVSVLQVVDLLDRVYIFMDLCERGDLLEYIRNKGPFEENRARYLFRQLVSAVEYLHLKDIAHRDLKCENVLLSKKDLVKIGDFGFARKCNDPLTGEKIFSNTFCGSAAYAAPEILEGIPYNPKMYDVWSLGCVLYIMLVASMPFDDSNIPKMLKIQKKRLLVLPMPMRYGLTGPCCSLIFHLLEPDVAKRSTITEVAQCPWFQEDI